MVCEEPHYKGSLLHLRNKFFQAKDVIVFVHGFTGDYVSTWGKPKVLLDDPRFNRTTTSSFYGFKQRSIAICRRSRQRRSGQARSHTDPPGRELQKHYDREPQQRLDWSRCAPFSTGKDFPSETTS